MGTRGRPGSGVEPLSETIRLRFTYNGKRYYETLDLRPTAANIKAATRMLASVKDQIRHGVFDYAATFPDSVRGVPAIKSRLTVRDIAKRWIDSHQVENSTKGTYLPGLNFWNSRFGDRPAAELTTLEIRQALTERSAEVTAKTVNNTLIVLRGMYRLALADEVVPRDPTQSIRNLKHQRVPPDPFTRSELERILGHIQHHHPVEVLRWFTFAFFTGLRPSEQVELKRDDLDAAAKKVRVQRAKVKGEVKSTKTHTERWVDLTGRALRAAEGDGSSEYLFPHPGTQTQWSKTQLEDRLHDYWYPTLEALGLRKRVSYQTRHTYATVNLMAGVNPAYISRQLGHVNMQMLLTTYSRWIDGADKDRERRRMEKALG